MIFIFDRIHYQHPANRCHSCRPLRAHGCPAVGVRERDALRQARVRQGHHLATGKQ